MLLLLFLAVHQEESIWKQYYEGNPTNSQSSKTDRIDANYLNEINLLIIDCSFSNLENPIKIESESESSNILISSCRFSDNKISVVTGLIQNQETICSTISFYPKGNCAIHNTIFYNTTATTRGNGAFSYVYSTDHKCTINQTAYSYICNGIEQHLQSSIFNFNKEFNFVYNNISHCTTESESGYNFKSTNNYITFCNFYDNTAKTTCVFNHIGTFIIKSSSYFNNTVIDKENEEETDYKPGILYSPNTQKDIQISECLIYNNNASYTISNTQGNMFVVKNSIFIGNTYGEVDLIDVTNITQNESSTVSNPTQIQTPEATISESQTPEATISESQTPEATISQSQTPEATISQSQTPEAAIPPTQCQEKLQIVGNRGYFIKANFVDKF